MQTEQQSTEDAVSYELHVSTRQSAEELEELRLQCISLVAVHLTQYIWQQDSFNLQSSETRKVPWSKHSVPHASRRHALKPAAFLWGVTRVGDNLADEWLIVWLICQITQKFPNVCARVWDNDGDFLLIEAAYSLPRWLNAETSSNRIWIQAGQVHIVPLPNKHIPTVPPAPTVQQAFQIVSSDTIDTTANSGFQNAIKAKLKGYPRKTKTDMHRARCLLPAKIAHVLQQQPQLISPAVQTFHYRDVQDMKAAAKLSNFPAQDLVTTIVVFNRALYAQLTQQEFQAPKGYPLPTPTHPTFKAAKLGMKLTCGFEMVMARHPPEFAPNAAAASQVSATADLSSAALVKNPQWAAYKASLVKNGYFKDNIPGSVQYKQLLSEALKAFGQNEAYQRAADAAAAPAEAIAALLQQPIDPEQFQDGPEDDDSWTTNGQADLEAELAHRQKELDSNVAKHAKRATRGLNDSGQAPEFDPSDMVAKLNAFVNTTSGHEGAEVPSSIDPDIGFSDAAFYQELKAALGSGIDKRGDNSEQQSDSELSSLGFTSDDGDDDSDEEVRTSGMSASAGDSQKQDSLRAQGQDSQPGSSQRHNSAQSQAQTGSASSHSHCKAHPHSQAGSDTAKEQQGANGVGLQRPSVDRAYAAVRGDAADSASDVMTATDSDDDDVSFTEAYDQALADELANSRVDRMMGAQSPADIPGNVADEPKQQAAAAKQSEGDDLKPLDLDMNLVQNLLQSYTAQQGLAGPAGNLAGLLGLDLPQNTE